MPPRSRATVATRNTVLRPRPFSGPSGNQLSVSNAPTNRTAALLANSVPPAFNLVRHASPAPADGDRLTLELRSDDVILAYVNDVLVIEASSPVGALSPQIGMAAAGPGSAGASLLDDFHFGPVPVGARIRSQRTLKRAEIKGGMLEIMQEVVVHVDGQGKPACVAESLSRMVF